MGSALAGSLHREALKPAHALKGNRSNYIDDEVEKLLRRVVREYSLRQIRVNYTQAHNDFLKLVAVVALISKGVERDITDSKTQ